MSLWRNFWNLEEFLPRSIKVFKDEKRGIEKVEVINPQSRYAPEKVRWYINKEEGITVVDVGSLEEEKELIEFEG